MASPENHQPNHQCGPEKQRGKRFIVEDLGFRMKEAGFLVVICCKPGNH
jgi:hypothetical protein